jgi:hypothetical protein
MDNKVMLIDDFLRVEDIEYNYNNLDDKITHIEILCHSKRWALNININNLNQNVKHLRIENCRIDNSFFFLPYSLKYLEIVDIDKTNFNNLPDTLESLSIRYNVIDSLNNLPPNLKYLDISCCHILNKDISNLPKNLKQFNIFTRNVFFNRVNGVNTTMIKKEDITPPNDYCVINVIH